MSQISEAVETVQRRPHSRMWAVPPRSCRCAHAAANASRRGSSSLQSLHLQDNLHIMLQQGRGAWRAVPLGRRALPCACAVALPEPGTVQEFHQHIAIQLPRPPAAGAVGGGSEAAAAAAEPGAWWPQLVERQAAGHACCCVAAVHRLPAWLPSAKRCPTLPCLLPRVAGLQGASGCGSVCSRGPLPRPHWGHRQNHSGGASSKPRRAGCSGARAAARHRQPAGLPCWWVGC